MSDTSKWDKRKITVTTRKVDILKFFFPWNIDRGIYKRLCCFINFFKRRGINNKSNVLLNKEKLLLALLEFVQNVIAKKKKKKKTKKPFSRKVIISLWNLRFGGQDQKCNLPPGGRKGSALFEESIFFSPLSAVSLPALAYWPKQFHF